MPEKSAHADRLSADAQHADSGRRSSPNRASHQPSAEGHAAIPVGECSSTAAAADGAPGAADDDYDGMAGPARPLSGLSSPCVDPVVDVISPSAETGGRHEAGALQRQQASADALAAAAGRNLTGWQATAEARTSRDPRLSASAMPLVAACHRPVQEAAVGGRSAPAATCSDDKPVITGLAPVEQPVLTAPAQQHTMRNIVLAVRCRLTGTLNLMAP